MLRLIKAYRDLQCPDKPALLVICPGMPDIPLPQGVEVIRHAMSHEQLVGYYRNALAFLFPSLHETFGMPILEAMASGCPVVTSNVTACPEVAGDSAVLVSPESTSAMTGAMRRIVQDQSYRLGLRERTTTRSILFVGRIRSIPSSFFLTAMAETSY
ncbi:glycosyltransferase [Alcanivorax sp. IO_7]|nr:glycosyltransferase [Alcanivorax sp. IO_7]